jgi:CBS domain-containing protein
MRTVQHILESKPRPTNLIQANVLVIDALNELMKVNLSYLVVMEGEQFRGIFSERDYARNVVLKGRSSSTTKVSEVMATNLPVVYLSDTFEHCMNTMNEHKTRYLLAFDDNDNFLGVITIHDLLRQVLTNREEVFDYNLANRLLDHDEKGRIY